MLGYFREKFTGWIALAILAAIALSFVFVGLNYTTATSTFAARVDGEDISAVDLENLFRLELQANPQIAQYPAEYRQQVRSQLLEQMIVQQVIDNYLDEAGYKITTADFTKYVHADPQFHEDGVFSEALYNEVIASRGRNVAQFEAETMRSLRRMQLQRAIRGSSVLTPMAYRKFLNLAYEQRIVTTATIDGSAVAEEVDVTDEMITAYYEDNPALYQLPETADIEYIEVLRSDVAGSVAVTEQELTEYYNDNADLYDQDEQRQARHILIQTGDDAAAAEALAGDLLARIQAGEAFEALAAEYSSDGGTASAGGDLGRATRSQLPEELGDAVFSMGEGELRGPIEGDFGFHIVRLDSILETGPLPFSEVRASILTELQDQRAEGLFMDRERALSDALFDATDLRSLAEATGSEIKSVAGFSRQGGEPFGTGPEVIDSIFQENILAGGQVSDLIQINADHTVVVSVMKHNEAKRQSLDEVREQIVATLTRNQTEELMASRAAEMQDSVDAGTEFTVAASSIGATVNAPLVLRRDSQESDQFLMASVFASPKPRQDAPSVGSTRNGAGGYTVYRIDAVMAGRPESLNVEQIDSGKLQLADGLGTGEFVAFVQALRASADVVIDQDVVAAQNLFQ